MLASYLLTAAIALAVGSNAQIATTTPPASSGTSSATSPSSTSSGRIIEIAVGAEVHKFTPDNVKANVGDTIRFNFYPGGHRVARAEYKQPCIPYEYTGANKRGFWTGVFTPQVITNPPPHYDVRVNDTDPIFFYCGAPGSCIQYSMVGVINPTDEMTLETQKLFAANSSLQLVPGEPFPSETLSPTATPTATSNSGSGQNNNVPTVQSSDSGSSLSAGAIAGIAIGGAAVLIIGAALIYMCGRRGGFETAYRKSMYPGLPPPGAMAEVKHPDSKSPGQQTLSTFAGLDRDPYRASAQSGHGAFSGTPPPPMSPGMTGYNTYQSTVPPGNSYPAPEPQANHIPLALHAGQTSPQTTSSPQFQSPIELPTAEHPVPGHSPPPQYPKMERSDSQTTGNGTYYRPSKPPA